MGTTTLLIPDSDVAPFARRHSSDNETFKPRHWCCLCTGDRPLRRNENSSQDSQQCPYFSYVAVKNLYLGQDNESLNPNAGVLFARIQLADNQPFDTIPRWSFRADSNKAVLPHEVGILNTPHSRERQF